MSEVIHKRYEFVLLFDVTNGNPNGDPDAGNMPRIDPETNHGIVTDVCIKRKIRNYVELVKKEEMGYEIYVKEAAVLNNTNKRAIEAIGKAEKNNKKLIESRYTEYMCKNFFDVRAFGAVMSTEINCGQVRGPIQFNFARSIDPIFQQEITVTRMAVTNEKDVDKERTFGRKFVVPYGLYRLEGYVSAPFANKVLYADDENEVKITQFNEDDLALLWEALINMFEHDHSASRGKMNAKKLFVFEHGSELGNYPSNKLFEKVSVVNKNPGEVARSYENYEVTLDKQVVPGVKIIEML